MNVVHPDLAGSALPFNDINQILKRKTFMSVKCSSQRRRNLFGRHGNSCTTFEGGTARNVKCRTTF